MDAFPDFMKNPANRIARSAQATPGVEGNVFDGADQRTCSQDATSAEHVHGFDEYMLVVQGCHTLLIGGERIPVKAGEEYLMPGGVPHGGEVVAGTRTTHAFGGHRADRERNVCGSGPGCATNFGHATRTTRRPVSDSVQGSRRKDYSGSD